MRADSNLHRFKFIFNEMNAKKNVKEVTKIIYSR